eukprot:m.156393 g.156393  ORF g.156393 m.156393 type:complete len:269 (-) comp11723_c2_seq22:222-1028(-)
MHPPHSTLPCLTLPHSTLPYHTHTPHNRLGCVIACTAPFEVCTVLGNSNVSATPVAYNAHDGVVVTPRGSIEVTVAVGDVTHLSDHGALDAATGRLDVHGSLLFTFADASVQTVPLHAILHHPVLTTSVSTVDFGHVRNPATRQLVLRNGGRSTVPWEVQLPPGCPFTCKVIGGRGAANHDESSASATAAVPPLPTGDGTSTNNGVSVAGVLDAFVTHTATVTTTLEITYAPHGDCRPHATTLRVVSPVHPDVNVALCGEGTLDEKYE